MYFSFAIILLVGIVAYFHYVQGLFSGLLSAVSAALAAMLAMSYFEPLADLLHGKAPDIGRGALLVLLFVVIYAICRTLFDNIVPGNVRLPAIVDKVGGAICGLIAGTFGIGTLAIAAQLLPFGPSIGAYSRYELTEERQVQLPTNRQSLDATVNDELKSDRMPASTPENPQAMYLPADDFVVAAVNRLSTGALEGDRPFSAIHPDLMNELFYARLGIQVGAKRVAVNTDKSPQVTLVGIYGIVDIGEADAEIPAIRDNKPFKPVGVGSDADKQLIVARVRFTQNASDSDHIIRISPGSVRIVSNGQDYYPYGTIENGVLAVNRFDDFLFLEAEKDVDFVYRIPYEHPNRSGAIVSKDSALAGALPPSANAAGKGNAKKPGKAFSLVGAKFKPGSFLEVKQMVRFDLSDETIEDALPSIAKGVVRKEKLIFEPAAGDPVPKMGKAVAEESDTPAKPGTAAPAAAAPAADAPFQFTAPKISSAIGFNINVGQHDGDSADVKFNSGTATLKDKKIAKLDVKPVDTLADLQKGDYPASEFVAPAGKKLVQISGTMPNPDWAWATDLGNFELADASGGKIKPSGVIVKVNKSQAERLVAKYDSENPVASLDQDADAIASDITLLFLVPDGTQLKELDFKGKKLSDALLKAE